MKLARFLYTQLTEHSTYKHILTNVVPPSWKTRYNLRTWHFFIVVNRTIIHQHIILHVKLLTASNAAGFCSKFVPQAIHNSLSNYLATLLEPDNFCINFSNYLTFSVCSQITTPRNFLSLKCISPTVQRRCVLAYSNAFVYIIQQ